MFDLESYDKEELLKLKQDGEKILNSMLKSFIRDNDEKDKTFWIYLPKFNEIDGRIKMIFPIYRENSNGNVKYAFNLYYDLLNNSFERYDTLEQSTEIKNLEVINYTDKKHEIVLCLFVQIFYLSMDHRRNDTESVEKRIDIIREKIETYNTEMIKLSPKEATSTITNKSESYKNYLNAMFDFEHKQEANDLNGNSEAKKYNFKLNAPNGLRYVNDDTLKIAFEFIKNGRISLETERIGGKESVVVHSNIEDLCDKNISTAELFKIVTEGNSLYSNERNKFSFDIRSIIDMVCKGCTYQKCPMKIAAYVLYLRNNGALDDMLEDRKKFRKSAKLNDEFDFEWNIKDGLKKVSQRVFEFANKLVDIGAVYISNVAVNNMVEINSAFSCDEYKLMNEIVENINVTNKSLNNITKTLYVPLDFNFSIDNAGKTINYNFFLCDEFTCRLTMCPIVVAGYIYYLRNRRMDSQIEKDRQYYEKNKEKIDKENAEERARKIALLEEERKNKLSELFEYQEKVKNIDLLADVLTNESQKNLHCMIKCDDIEETSEIIKRIEKILIKNNKIQSNNIVNMSLQNLMSCSAYDIMGTSSEKEIQNYKDNQKLIKRYAFEYQSIEKDRLYVFDGIKEFLEDYRLYKDNYSSGSYSEMRRKQLKNMLDILTNITSNYYIIICGNEKEIDELLGIDLRIQYVYQSYVLTIPSISIDEMFNMYLNNIKPELIGVIRDNYDKYKKDFVDYISLNKNLLPFSDKELVNYLVMYANSRNKVIFPEDSYKRETIEESLKNIIGLENVKEKLKEFEQFVIFQIKAKGNNIKVSDANMHMIFTGNPGTGKTTIARIMAKMLFDLGVIKENKLIEAERKDLIGVYVGETAPKTSKLIEKAIGGVLFIDEAYSLYNEAEEDYGSEAIATLIKAMEDRKGELVVIFAGYKNEMKKFVDMNPGISSRIGYTFDFEDYSAEELAEIFDKKASNMGFSINEDAKTEIMKIMKYFCNVENIGNGRFVDKVVQETMMKKAKQIDEEIDIITKDDIPTINEMTEVIYNGKGMIDVSKITDEDLRRTARHEIGHAVARLLLFKNHGIKKITINAEGTGTLGYVMYDNSISKYTRDKTSIINRIKVSLGGMAAEKMYYGEYENGNTSDLNTATNMAQKMITSYGMSDLGLAQIEKISGDMSVIVYNEINKILKNCFEEIIELLEDNRDRMDKLVDYIMVHREINGEKIDEIFT